MVIMKKITNLCLTLLLLMISSAINAFQLAPDSEWRVTVDKIVTAEQTGGDISGQKQSQYTSRAVGDDCSNPILVDYFPFADLGQTTTGRGNYYDNTCLNDFDGGEDIIYKLELSSDMTIEVTIDPKGTPRTGMALSGSCPLDAFCLAMSYDFSSGQSHGFTVELDAGTYYLMIDTWPYPTSIPDFNLTIDIMQLETTVFAGYDLYSCSDDEIFLADATATNYLAVIWSTLGDGFFDDDMLLNSTYYPGQGDLAGGSVMLCLTAYPSGTGDPMTDCLILTFLEEPTVNILPNSHTICVGDEMDFTGLITATNYSAVQWFTPDGSGAFSTANILEPVYTPSSIDYLFGCITLGVSVLPINPCTTTADDYMLLCFSEPEVTCPDDMDVCFDADPFQLTGGYPDGGTYSGSGVSGDVFDPFLAGVGVHLITYTYTDEFGCLNSCEFNITVIQPEVVCPENFEVCIDTGLIPLNALPEGGIYTGNGIFMDEYFLPTDAGAGTHLITYTYMDAYGCLNFCTFEVTVNPLPAAAAGANRAICLGASTTLGAAAVPGSTYSWTSVPAGFTSTLANPSVSPLVNTTYTITETIMATGCSKSNSVVVTVNPLPAAAAGANRAICLGASTTLGAAAVPGNTYSWTSVPAGFTSILANPSVSPLVNTTYTVTETITATGCSRSNSVVVTVVPMPTAFAGDNDTVICGQTYSLSSAFATNYSSLFWSSSGDGSFDDETLQNPIYSPGAGDCTNCEVELCLTAYPVDPCLLSITDCMVLSVMIVPQAMQPSGSGTSADPYLIDNLQNLYWIAEQTNTGNNFSEKYFLQTTNIDASETETWFCGLGWQPIGNNVTPFKGSYDGGCFAIESLSINRTTENYLGLFGKTDGAEIQKLRLMNFDITGNSIVGSLAGHITNTTDVQYIDAVNVNIYLSGSYGGGMIGQARDNSTIYRCSSSGELSKDGAYVTNWIGGLIGALSNSALVEECYSLTNVTSMLHNDYGGLVGVVWTGGIIKNSYARGSVIGTWAVAGGFVSDNQTGNISNSYSTGLVSAPQLYVGGFVGRNHSGIYANNFWDKETSNQNTSAGATGKTTEEMKTLTTFTNAGWNFENVWAMDGVTNDGYPALKWQLQPAADAGPDATIADNETYELSGSAENYSAVMWTTNGDGTFSSPQQLSSTYFPGTQDKLNGSVELCLTASAISPCLESAVDCMILTINTEIAVNAGPDDTICVETRSQGMNRDCYLLNPTITGNYSTVHWTTSGDGVFDDAWIENACYTHGPNDLSNGFVILTIQLTDKSSKATYSDSMVLTFQKSPSVNAGPDDAVCCGFPYTFADATAADYDEIQWFTNNGSGDFDFADIVNPTYYPSVNDCMIGTIEFCISASPIDPCTIIATDCMELTLYQLPEVNCPPDFSACLDAPEFPLSGATPPGGAYSGPGIANGKFNAASAGIGTHNVTYNYTDENGCPGSCTFSITVTNPPSVNIIPDTIFICESDIVDFTGLVTAQYWTGALWIIIDGSGTFVDDTMLETIYTPSIYDFELGCIVLGVIVNPIEPCTEPAFDLVTICFQPPPSVFAGADLTVCSNETMPVSGQVENSCGYEWSTSGDGYFDDNLSLNTFYNPGVNDILAGEVELGLTAIPCDPCEQNASDYMMLYFQEPPLAYAGEDADYCCQYYTMGDATAMNYSDLLWTTSGDGAFSSTTILNPDYYPGPEDRNYGIIDLCLTAYPIDPCEDAVTDCMTLNYYPYPEANAGSDVEICGCEPYTIIHAEAANYTQLLWTITNGTGYLDFADILTPTYYPSQEDCDQGNIELSLHVLGFEICPPEPDTDCMTLSFVQPPDADAGGDATICVGDEMDFAGRVSVGHYLSLQWSTPNGMGGFYPSDEIPEPVYIPSPFDYLQGCIQLILIATPNSPCEVLAISEMNLCFQQPPFADAGDDATIAENESWLLSGSAENYASIVWTTSGDGSFNDPEILTPTYTPGTLDKQQGIVDLCLNADPISPCAITANDCMTLNINTEIIVYAGPDETICVETAKEQGKLGFYQLNGVVTGTYTSLKWNSSGTGFFDNDFILNPTYTYSFDDLLAGSVSLTLTVTRQGKKSNLSDAMVLSFQKSPYANAGNDATICQGEPYLLADAYAENYDHIIWLTSGAGTFSDEYSLNPIYYPSFLDHLIGSVTLTLSVAPLDPCPSGYSDEMTLYFQIAPSANAGNDATICQGESYSLAEAYAENYDHLIWLTSGAGTFSDEYSLNPIYYPSFLDHLIGSVTLTLSVAPLDPCPSGYSDEMTLYFQPAPSANAGNDATICQGEPYSLAEAYAENYDHLIWLTSGAGTFSDEYSLNPIYYPSFLDHLIGSVTLTLSVAPLDPCPSGYSDEMTLYFQPAPSANAGNDATICQGEPYSLAEAYAENYDHLIWLTSGAGTFSDEYSLNPIYYPSFLDHLIGSVTLTLSVAPLDPCPSGYSDELILSFQPKQQTVQINPGWSGISTYLALTNNDLETVLNPVLNDLVVLYNHSGFFYPAGGISTINEWDTYSGYIGKFNNTTSLNFLGCDPASKTVYLDEGWNIVPVLCDEPYSIEELFSGNTYLQIVKEVAGTGVYWPAYSINTIGNVFPGKAYFVRVSSATSIDYSLPLKEMSDLKPPDLSKIATPWNTVFQNPTSHIVVFEPSETVFIENDILGGFNTEGLCAGLLLIEDVSAPFAITLNATDLYATEKTGFETEEPIQWKLYRPITAEIFDVEVNYKPEYHNSGLFVPNGLSVADSVKLTLAGITNTNSRQFKIYPNPNDGTFTIESDLENAFIVIYNTSGVAVYHNYLSIPAEINIASQPKGMYYIKIETEREIYFEKFIKN
jgi:hypothetical protein